MNTTTTYDAELKELAARIDRLNFWFESQSKRANKKLREQRKQELQEANARYQDLLNKAMEQITFNHTLS